MLYIVATPIGNLSDITLRALDVLKSVEYILCEDTRVTRKLLDHFEIKDKKVIAYHHHSNQNQIDKIIEIVKNNNVALVTDAGTPGISDPGNQLVHELVSNSVSQTKIVPIPGASAVTTALSISGFPTDKFIFKGFIPHKRGRETFFKEVINAEQTVVFFESCHRIIKTLNSLKELNFNKQIVVCRELTKKFESFYRGSISEVLNQVNSDPVKGEYVVVVNKK